MKTEISSDEPVTTYAFFARRENRTVPTQQHTHVRLFRSTPGAAPEVVGRGRFAVVGGEPVDVALRVGDTLFLPDGSWDPVQGEWICDARSIATAPPPVALPPASITQSWCPTCGQRNVGDRHNGGAAWKFENCPGIPQAVRYAIVTDPDGRVAELNADGVPTGRRVKVRAD